MSQLQYKGFNREKAAETQKKIEEEESTGFAKIPEGLSAWRVLPLPHDSELEQPWAITYAHWLAYQTVEGERKMRFLCPRHMRKEKCEACMLYEKMRASPNPIDQNSASKLYRAKREVYINAVSRAREYLGSQTLKVGPMIHDQMSAILDLEGDFSDPTEDGFDLVIRRKGTQMNTEYAVASRKKDKQVMYAPLHEDTAVAAAWIESQANLMRYLVPTDDHAMGLVLRGQDPRPYLANKYAELGRKQQKLSGVLQGDLLDDKEPLPQGRPMRRLSKKAAASVDFSKHTKGGRSDDRPSDLEDEETIHHAAAMMDSDIPF